MDDTHTMNADTDTQNANNGTHMAEQTKEAWLSGTRRDFVHDVINNILKTEVQAYDWLKAKPTNATFAPRARSGRPAFAPR